MSLYAYGSNNSGSGNNIDPARRSPVIVNECLSLDAIRHNNDTEGGESTDNITEDMYSNTFDSESDVDAPELNSQSIDSPPKYDSLPSGMFSSPRVYDGVQGDTGSVNSSSSSFSQSTPPIQSQYHQIIQGGRPGYSHSISFSAAHTANYSVASIDPESCPEIYFHATDNEPASRALYSDEDDSSPGGSPSGTPCGYVGITPAASRVAGIDRFSEVVDTVPPQSSRSVLSSDSLEYSNDTLQLHTPGAGRSVTPQVNDAFSVGTPSTSMTNTDGVSVSGGTVSTCSPRSMERRWYSAIKTRDELLYDLSKQHTDSPSIDRSEVEQVEKPVSNSDMSTPHAPSTLASPSLSPLISNPSSVEKTGKFLSQHKSMKLATVSPTPVGFEATDSSSSEFETPVNRIYPYSSDDNKPLPKSGSARSRGSADNMDLRRTAIVNASSRPPEVPVVTEYSTPMSSPLLSASRTSSKDCVKGSEEFTQESPSSNRSDIYSDSIVDGGYSRDYCQPPTTSHPHSWVEYTSEEGWPYYYNEFTGESTWTKPAELKASDDEDIAAEHEVEDINEAANEQLEESDVPEGYIESSQSGPRDVQTVNFNIYDDSSRLSPCSSSVDSDKSISTHSVLSGAMSSSLVEQRNRSGQSVLHISAEAGNDEALQLLLSNGADANTLDGHGASPLQLVCQRKPSQSQTECIRHLVNHGADVNIRDNNGNTPMHMLLLWGIGTSLLSGDTSSGPISEMTKQEVSVVRNMQMKSVEVLIGSGRVDTTLSNNDGDQPLHVATKLGLLGCMQLLLKPLYIANDHTNSKNSQQYERSSSTEKSGKRGNVDDVSAASACGRRRKYSSGSNRSGEGRYEDISKVVSRAGSNSSHVPPMQSGQAVHYYSSSDNSSTRKVSYRSKDKSPGKNRHLSLRKENRNMQMAPPPTRPGEKRELDRLPSIEIEIPQSLDDVRGSSDDDGEYSIALSNDESHKETPVIMPLDGRGSGSYGRVGTNSTDMTDDREEIPLDVYIHLGEMRDGWVEYCTEEGDKYYYNNETDHVQWKHPFQHEIERKARCKPPQVTLSDNVDINSESDTGSLAEEVPTDSCTSGKDVASANQPKESMHSVFSNANSAAIEDEGIKKKLREKYKEYSSSRGDLTVHKTSTHRGMQTSSIEVALGGVETIHRSNTGSMRTMTVSTASNDMSNSKKPATTTASSYYQYNSCSRASGATTTTGSNTNYTGSASANSEAATPVARVSQNFAEQKKTELLPEGLTDHTRTTQPIEQGKQQFETPTKPRRSSFNRVPSVSSLSGESEASRERHLEVWGRFFENALLAGSDSNRKGRHENGVSVGGFTPVFARNKKKLADSWNIPPSTSEYESLVANALSLKAKQSIDTERDGNVAVSASDVASAGNWAVLAAAMRGDVDTAEDLLLNGFNPSCVDEQIRSPLHHVCRSGDVKMVALLSDYGADIDATDFCGQTPLHVAVEYNRVDVVTMLLQCAASPNIKDNMGNTPMHIVASNGNIECCKILLEYGAEVDGINTSGRTPLDVANNTLKSHQGSRPPLGVRKIISLLAAFSHAHNGTTMNERLSHQLIVDANVDEEYSLPSESPSVPEDGSYGISDDSSSVDRGIRLHDGRRLKPPKSNDGASAAAKVRNLKDRARRSRADSSSSVNSQGRHQGNSHRHREQSRALPYAESRCGGYLDRKFHDAKKNEWVERSRLSQSFGVRGESLIESSGDIPYDSHEHELHPTTDMYSQSPLRFPHSHTSPSALLSANHPAASLSISTDVIDGDPTADENGSCEDNSDSQPSSASGVGHIVWGAASLIGATLGLFGTSHSKTEKENPKADDDLWTRQAPPTDAELLRRGMGFQFDADTVPQSPRPPAIVLDDIKAHTAAYRSGNTPHRGEHRLPAPDEVVVAVEMARAAERLRRTPKSSRNEITSRRAASIPTGIPEGRIPGALHLPLDEPSGGVDNRRHNQYSMGPSLPTGVSWRYVDVLNDKGAG